ncbi:hypothetical protein [Melissospora conviva]|uniref:hypothetical protein n=1 Tax=Melissospora conviva TaxID=3388432 RepID=UPI003C253CAC
MSHETPTVDELDEDVCDDGYPEHQEEVTYQGADGVGWACRRCGAEGWEPSEA